MYYPSPGTGCCVCTSAQYCAGSAVGCVLHCAVQVQAGCEPLRARSVLVSLHFHQGHVCTFKHVVVPHPMRQSLCMVLLLSINLGPNLKFGTGEELHCNTQRASLRALHGCVYNFIMPMVCSQVPIRLVLAQAAHQPSCHLCWQ